MSLLNDKLKNITLKELLSIIIILFAIQFIFNNYNIVHIDSVWIYFLIILYFIFKLRDVIFQTKNDILNVFSADSLKYIFFIVILNIFISYGLLYLSNFILAMFPNFNIFSHDVSNSIVISSFIATIFISPICEELIFRGVFINRLKLIVPTLFAVLISALFFASLHSFGSIFSAFIFAVCMGILYLKTENIFVVIFAHFLNNLFAEIIVGMDSNNILFTNNLVMGAMSLLAIVSFAVILVFIYRELNKIK